MLKKFIKCNVKASLWLCLFIVSQSVIMFGVMVWKVYHDMEFSYRFADLFEPIVTMTNQIEKQRSTYMALEELMSGEIGVVLLLSSLFIILVSLFISKWKNYIIIKRMDLRVYVRYLIAGIVINLILTILVELIPEQFLKTYSMSTTLALSNGLWLDCITTGMLVPIAEECIFRFGIQRSLYSFHYKFAVLYQGVIFGVLHGNLVQGSYACVLGVLFGILYYKTDNLLCTILIHIGINLSSVLAAYLFKNEVLGLMVIGGIVVVIECFVSKVTVQSLQS